MMENPVALSVWVQVLRFVAHCNQVKIWRNRISNEFWASNTEARKVPVAGPNEKLLSSDLELCAAFVVTPLGKWAGLREADKAQGGNALVFPEGGPLKQPQNNKAAGLR